MSHGEPARDRASTIPEALELKCSTPASENLSHSPELSPSSRTSAAWTKTSTASRGLTAPLLQRTVSSSSSNASLASHNSIPSPSRTPSRTKRPSFSSVISERAHVPSLDEEVEAQTPVDYRSYLSFDEQLPFTSPSDGELLNSLGSAGLETCQIRHSVLTHACDASSALWWIVRTKTLERRAPAALPSRQSSVRQPNHRPHSSPLDGQEDPALSHESLLRTPKRRNDQEALATTPTARALSLEPSDPVLIQAADFVAEMQTAGPSKLNGDPDPGSDPWLESSPPTPQRYRSSSINMVGKLFPRKSSLSGDLASESSEVAGERTASRPSSSLIGSSRGQSGKQAKKILMQLKLWFAPNEQQQATLRRSTSARQRSLARGGSTGPNRSRASHTPRPASVGLSRRSSLASASRQAVKPSSAPKRRASNASHLSTDRSRPASIRSLPTQDAAHLAHQPWTASKTTKADAILAPPMSLAAPTLKAPSLAARHTPTSTTVHKRRASTGQHRRTHSRHPSSASSIGTRRSSASSDDDREGDTSAEPREPVIAEEADALGDVNLSNEISERFALRDSVIDTTDQPSRTTSVVSLTSLDSSQGRSNAVFTAHRTHHLFGHPTQPSSSFAASPRTHRSSKPASSRTGAAKSYIRDVFSRADDGEWVDDDLSAFGSGFGQKQQTDHLTSTSDPALKGSPAPKSAINVFESRYRGLNGAVSGEPAQKIRGGGSTAIFEEDEAETD
ncbi:hypothetical protein OIV83_002800 [Microbotryomycetes sp. JL201]|nr:hypothetical protein OIV83_002800 [Microbotryomycetes sp. JL201]